jgi:hypothetical protein
MDKDKQAVELLRLPAPPQYLLRLRARAVILQDPIKAEQVAAICLLAQMGAHIVIRDAVVMVIITV